MWKLSTGGDSGLGRQLERSMRNWEISRSQKMASETKRTKGAEPFVTISRAVGSGGGALARKLGEQIQWSVLDKELLQVMADNDQVREALYQSMDERNLSLFEEMVRSLTANKHDRHDYSRKLGSAILSVACQGNAIFLGRAADLVLPRDVGLRLRVVASPETCVENFAKRHNLSVEDAKDKIRQIEDECAEFIESQFHVTAGDPNRYDMTINLDRWTSDEAIGLILSAMRLRKMIDN